MKPRTILLLALLLQAMNLAAGDRLPEPNWSREAALATAETSEVGETLGWLYQLVREGRSDELMAEVRRIAESDERSGPERDLILQSLALALGDFEPRAVAPEILEYLAETRSLTLVAHEDHPGMGTPLYNVRAAAAGALAEWSRVERKTVFPEAERYFDAASFLSALSGESGSAPASFVRAAPDRLDPAELEAVVAAAPGMDDPRTASIVLAELAPGLLGRPAVDELLFGLLAHPELGATAALVLGQSNDGQVLDRLAAVAAGGDSLASGRASLAIDAFLARERDR